MTDDLQTGLLLLFVGMITVFTVLGIVVLTGKAIIYVLNNAGKRLEGQLSVSTQTSSREVPDRTDKPQKNKKKLAAAITAAMIVTKGKGMITRITREDK